MKIVNNILYLAFSEAEKAGIKSNTIKLANHRQSASWEFIKDPDDRRKLLIRFDTLKDHYKQLITATYGNVMDYYHRQSIYNNPLFTLTADDNQTIENYRLPDGRKLPEQYINLYKQECRYLNLLTNINKSIIKSLGFGSVSAFGSAVRQLIATDSNCMLPTSRTRLSTIVKQYKKLQAQAVINRHAHRWNNTNRAKITGAVADYLLSQYCLVNKPTVPMLAEMYQQAAAANNWPRLDQSAIYSWLHRPKQKRVWTLIRDGVGEWQKLYSHYLKLQKTALFPNAYWVIDGSKLDMIHYFDNQLKMAAKLKIDPVFDVYSEKIIGYSISHTEDHTDHFRAMKMAAQTAQARPYLITYDHQSGHLTTGTQQLYNQLVAKGGTHYPHRVKAHGPAELLFKNLQTQVISRWWFSDRQSPMSRRAQSKVNMEVIRQKQTDPAGNKWSNTDLLPDLNEVIRAWQISVAQWNNAPHSTIKGKTRNQVYAQPAIVSQPLSADEIKRIFWVTTPRPRQYTRGGITLDISGETYEYEVYNSQGLPDIDFRENYTGTKLYRRYDPDNLEQIELLVSTGAGMQVVAVAELKHEHVQVPILMNTGDKQRWQAEFETRDIERQRIQEQYNQMVARTGIDNNALIAHQNQILKNGTDDAELVLKTAGNAPKQLRSQAEEDWLNEL